MRPSAALTRCLLPLSALAFLSACQPPRYDVIACQSGDRLGIMVRDDNGWFWPKPEPKLSFISFGHETLSDYAKDPPIEGRYTYIWGANSKGTYDDDSHWVSGRLFMIGDIPENWIAGVGPTTAKPAPAKPTALKPTTAKPTLATLVYGEHYLIEVDGKRQGSASFQYGVDTLPYCEG